MLIHSVKLENAKSYQDGYVKFTPGVNAIVGHNGAGKSTIVEAIGLAIFDDLPYTRNEFIRAGAKTAVITVAFESSQDSRTYEVERRIGGSNSYFVYDPETGFRLREGKTDVCDFLKDHLGLDATAKLETLFRDAVGVPQGTFTAAFQLRPTPRKSVFDPLLQVQDYRDVYGKLREPLNVLKERHQRMQVEIAGKRGQLIAIPEIEQELSCQVKELASAEGSLTELQKQLSEWAKKREELEAVREQLQRLRNEMSQVELRRQAVDRELSSALQALVDAEIAEKLVKENTAGYEIYVEAQAQQKQLDEKLRQRTELEAKRNKIDQQIAVSKSSRAQIEQELASIEEAVAVLAELREPVQRQEKLETALQQARQDATKYKALDEQVQNEVEAVSRMSAQAAKLETAFANMQTLEAEAASLREQGDSADKTMDDLRTKNAMIETKANALKEQAATLSDIATAVCPICEQPLTDEHRQEMIRRNEEQIAEMRARYAEIQQQIRALQEQTSQVQQRLRAVEAEILALPRATEVERRKAELVLAQQLLQNLTLQRDELAGVEGRIGTIQEELAQLDNPKRRYEIAANRAAQKESILNNQTVVERKLKDLLAQHVEVELALEQFATLDAAMDACAAAIEQNGAAYRIVLGNQRLAQSVDTHKTKVDAAEVQKHGLQEQSESLQTQLSDVEQHFDEEAYQQAKQEEQTHQVEMGALQTRIEVLRRQQDQSTKALQRLHQLHQEMEENEHALLQIEKQTSALTKVRDTLREAGPYVTRVLIQQVSGLARRYFSDIMTDWSRHLSWNEDYGITLAVGQHIREFAQLSGGEQMTAALAVRLAMLRELTSIDIAFFDEPTANLDDERRDALAQQILKVEGFRQLFIISHDDTFEQATQNLIRVERKNCQSVITTA